MDYAQEVTLIFIFFMYSYFCFKVILELNKDRKKNNNQNIIEDKEQNKKLIQSDEV